MCWTPLLEFKKELKYILSRFHATFAITCYTRLNVEMKVDIQV